MAFAAIYIPNFPIQAVVRSEPELAIHPLALIDGPPPTYSVIATNRLAAHLGVTGGMTKAAAAQFAGVQVRPRGTLQESGACGAARCGLVLFPSRGKHRAGNAAGGYRRSCNAARLSAIHRRKNAGALRRCWIERARGGCRRR